jgi:hypothetical protein
VKRAFLVVCASGLLVALPTAFAGSAADPGVSSTTIILGGTSPLTGPAASYASVARGAKAYFASINAKNGVAGGGFAFGGIFPDQVALVASYPSGNGWRVVAHELDAYVPN